MVPETSYHPPWYSADTNHMTPRLPDAVEHWPLDRLIPCARNARTHDDVQVAQIAASIVEFGWTNAESGYEASFELIISQLAPHIIDVDFVDAELGISIVRLSTRGDRHNGAQFRGPRHFIMRDFQSELCNDCVNNLCWARFDRDHDGIFVVGWFLKRPELAV